MGAKGLGGSPWEAGVESISWVPGDPWAAGLIYKNGWLSRGQYDCKAGLRTITHSTETAKSQITGMNIIKALSDTK